MRINPVVGQALALRLAIVNERIIGKLSIVCMVVQDLDPALFGRPFESMFSLYCFLAREAPLKIDERVPRVLVHEKQSHICIVVVLPCPSAERLAQRSLIRAGPLRQPALLAWPLSLFPCCLHQPSRVSWSFFHIDK